MKKTYKIEAVVEIDISNRSLKESIQENGLPSNTSLDEVFELWMEEVGPSEMDLENSELEPKVISFKRTVVNKEPK